jgi:hypothetical protein
MHLKLALRPYRKTEAFLLPAMRRLSGTEEASHVRRDCRSDGEAGAARALFARSRDVARSEGRVRYD